MNYEMGGTILSKTVKETDLRVTMNANMKVSEQCRIAASKGNQVLGMIRRNPYNSVLKMSTHYPEKRREYATHRNEICSEDSYRPYINNIRLEF